MGLIGKSLCQKFKKMNMLKYHLYTHSPLSEEQFQDLSALYPLQRTLHSSVHAVDVFQEVLDYVTDITQ